MASSKKRACSNADPTTAKVAKHGFCIFYEEWACPCGVPEVVRGRVGNKIYATAEEANAVAQEHVAVLRKDGQYCGMFSEDDKYFSSRRAAGMYAAKCGDAGGCDVEVAVWVNEGLETGWPSDDYFKYNDDEEEEVPVVEEDVDILSRGAAEAPLEASPLPTAAAASTTQPQESPSESPSESPAPTPGAQAVAALQAAAAPSWESLKDHNLSPGDMLTGLLKWPDVAQAAAFFEACPWPLAGTGRDWRMDRVWGHGPVPWDGLQHNGQPRQGEITDFLTALAKMTPPLDDAGMRRAGRILKTWEDADRNGKFQDMLLKWRDALGVTQALIDEFVVGSGFCGGRPGLWADTFEDIYGSGEDDY